MLAGHKISENAFSGFSTDRIVRAVMERSFTAKYNSSVVMVF